MKLKCEQHDRRVVVLPGGKQLHREDGTECNSSRLKYNSERRAGKEILMAVFGKVES